MKISINWISDYVDITGLDMKELALKFTMSTAEIEEVEFKGEDIKNVVVHKNPLSNAFKKLLYTKYSTKKTKNKGRK